MKKAGIYISAAVLALGALVSRADDTEIYINGAATAGTPYLHIMLDYRPSVFNTLCSLKTSCAPPFMSNEAYMNLEGYYADQTGNVAVSTFYAFVAVMETVMENPKYDPIKVALIAPNKNDGGTILKEYTQLGPEDDSDGSPEGRDAIIEVLTSIPEAVNGADAHKLSPKETYFEWFRYINGLTVLNGKNTAGNFTSVAPDPVIPDFDLDTLRVDDDSTYQSPITDANECPKMYSILMGMNVENQDDDWNDEIERDMHPLAARRKFENMMRWLHRSDTDLFDGFFSDPVSLQKSWVISDSGSLGQTPDWAEAGGTGSVLSLADPKALEKELGNAFKEVISVSSTFVAASVPVNVFNQTETLDNLYVALFEAQSTVRWPGNLKKLKLVDSYNAKDPTASGGDGVFDRIVDVNGAPGFETTGDNRGRIAFNAHTFWTDIDTLPAIVDDKNVPDNVDGRVVARGGAGQKIDGFVNYGSSNYFIGDTNGDTSSGIYGPRKVYVEPASFTNGVAVALANFNADNTTADALKALMDLDDPSMSRGDAMELIKWGRGQDVVNNSSSARSWIMADAIHSRPVALNYGLTEGYTDRSKPNIRIFMGTGDGLFHIIENTDSSGAETGREVFAFYPRELLKNIKLYKDNSRSALKMPYGVDGAPVILTNDKNKDGTLDYYDNDPDESDEAYVYFGLRRGGSSYYALDVSDPDNTKLLWKITRTDGGDFDELGLTFSTPVVGSVKYDGSSVDVLVFAGGYNGGWDDDYNDRVGKDLNDADDTVGNAIYVVNARTGDLIWKAVHGNAVSSSNTEYTHPGLVDSIPSDVAVLENLNGNIHRIYVGDTGGAVWRVDLPEGSSDDHRSDNWFVTKLAELGTDGPSADRRFFHAPDIVETYDSIGNYDGVLLASGDRAHPNETNVENYLFYIKDRKYISGTATVKAENTVTNPPGRYVFDHGQDNGLADQTDCDEGDEDACNAPLPNGWKKALQRSGEKGLSTPLVDGGRIFATSFRPATVATCAPSEGSGSVYLLNLSDGTAYKNKSIFEIGPGIPPSPTLLGDVILLPGGGIDKEEYDDDPTDDPTDDGTDDGTDDDDDRGDDCDGSLCTSIAKKFFQIYWREPGVDKL